MKRRFLNIKKDWVSLWENKAYLLTWVCLLILVFVVLKFVSLFLVFNESRSSGIIIDDFVLNALEPQNVSSPLFCITWIVIFTSLPMALTSPKRCILVFVSIISIGLIRCIAMYMLPLEPPSGIIPLRDEFLEGTFYDNRVLLKDLFFSGHTANLALLIFLVEIKWVKYVISIATLIVGFLLLKQHVHYTIDVLAAPFFAYLAYRIGAVTAEFIDDKMAIKKQNEKIPNSIKTV